MRTIALCLIIKNEKENLERLVMSTKDHVNKVYLTDTGSTDGSIREMERLCKLHSLPLEVSHFEWVDNFSKARNFNFRDVKEDWILWLDGDDELEILEGQGLRALINKVELSGGTGINMEYKYVSDDEDNSLNEHLKLRVVKNGFYSWTHKVAGEVPIHENLFPLEGVETKDFTTLEMRVKHHMTMEQADDSKQRNIRILRASLEKEGDKPDPRTVFLLGRELSTVDREESAKYLEQFIEIGGLEGEMLHAAFMLAKYHEERGEFSKQLEWGIRGIGFHPLHPLGYITAAEGYKNKGMWKEVITMCEQALEKKIQVNENVSFSEYSLKKLANLELANAYNEIEEHEKALEIVREMSENLTKEEMKDAQLAINKIVFDSNTTKTKKALNTLANIIIGAGDLKKLAGLSDSLPHFTFTLKPVIELRRSLGLNKEWKQGNIVIYAPTGIEEWDENSLETGIGGSETAVIEMAKRWGKAGYHVTVYGDVNECSYFGNVEYVPSQEIDWADEFDIFISWRNIDVFREIEISARKRLLWLHDVPIPSAYTREVLEKIDKVIVLSKYHRSLLPEVPDEKIYISRNGVDFDHIAEVGKMIKRGPRKVIYASQPTRGLEQLLEMWEDVKKEVPDAELAWAYGWDNYDIMIERGIGDQEFKDRMVRKMRELGVVDLGRLGKEELYKEFASSGIFAYPSTFPEISCIVMAEAQASGCYPISTGYAALSETQIVGDKVELDKFKDKLIERLKNPIFVKVKDAGTRFGWDEVAKEWMNDLFYGVEWEDESPLVSIVHITGRNGGMGMLKDSIQKQEYKNMELIIIDKLYEERAKEVADYLKDLDIPWIHLPDPKRNPKYKYGLCHAHNAALSVANGELLVFLQDFFEIPNDGVQKFVDIYLNNQDALISGVDKQYAVKNFDWADKINANTGKKIEWGEQEWESMWMQIGKGRRISAYAREWEANWAAAPKKVLEKLGGWNIEWDRGFGWDNVDIAFRHIELGGTLVIDESNMAKGIRHENDWQADPTHSNASRFMSYAQATQQSPNPRLVNKFESPRYSNKFNKLIKEFKDKA